MPMPTPEWSHCPHQKTPVHTKSVSTNQMPDRQCFCTGKLYMKLSNGVKQPKCTPTFPSAHSTATPMPTQTLKVNPECSLDRKKEVQIKLTLHITLSIHKHKQVYLHIHKHTNILTSVCRKVYTGYQCVIKEQLLLIV